jgi:hypothetical protein
MERIRKDVSELQQMMKGIGEAMVEHRIRLENGTKTFAKMDEKLSDIDKRTMPKQISVGRTVSYTFGSFVVVATALWGLSVMLSDRPTTSQVKDIMLDHGRHGHEELRKDLTTMQSSISLQGVLIKEVRTQSDGIRASQEATNKKLDALFLRRQPIR